MSMNQFITNRKAVIEESTEEHFKDKTLWMNGPTWLTETSKYPQWEISRTSSLTSYTDNEKPEV